MTDTVHVCADIGLRHGGNPRTARRLIDSAVEAGADSVKIQVVHPEALTLPVTWQDGNAFQDDRFDDQVAAMLADSAYADLAAHAAAQGAGLGIGVFDPRGIELAEAIDASYLRISSGDLTHHRLLHRAAETGRRLVLSTGMATLAEIEQAVDIVFRLGREDVVLLHGVSVYPAPLERMNLSFLDVLARAFDLPVGLSDHTGDGFAAAIAAGMGVSWIEKHLRPDGPPDPTGAQPPAAFAGFVANLRLCEAACRWRRPKVGEAEITSRHLLRRGLYAAREIEPGDRLQPEDILVVRPEGPMGPNDVSRLIGATARVAVARFAPFTPDQVMHPWRPG